MSLLTDFQSVANVMKSALSKKADKSELTPAGDITDTASQGYAVAGDVCTALSGKQGTLTAGTGISISNDIISATGVLPSGTNNGDILVWNGTAWVTKPSWQTVYQPVEYIENNNRYQYINSGFVLTTNSEVEIEFDMADATADKFVFGARQSYQTKDFSLMFFKESHTPVEMRAVYGTEAYFTGSYPATKQKYKLGKGKLYIDDTLVNTYSNASPSLFNGNFYLFTANNNGSLFEHDAKVKIYSCKVYEDGVIVRDFVPCYHKFEGTIGLFDKANGIFYKNAGSGTFTKGADI